MKKTYILTSLENLLTRIKASYEMANNNKISFSKRLRYKREYVRLSGIWYNIKFIAQCHKFNIGG